MNKAASELTSTVGKTTFRRARRTASLIFSHLTRVSPVTENSACNMKIFCWAEFACALLGSLVVSKVEQDGGTERYVSQH